MRMFLLKPVPSWSRRCSAKSSTSAVAASASGRSVEGRPRSRASTGDQARRIVNRASCLGPIVVAGVTSTGTAKGSPACGDRPGFARDGGQVDHQLRGGRPAPVAVTVGVAGTAVVDAQRKPVPAAARTLAWLPVAAHAPVSARVAAKSRMRTLGHPGFSRNCRRVTRPSGQVRRSYSETSGFQDSEGRSRGNLLGRWVFLANWDAGSSQGDVSWAVAPSCPPAYWG